MRQIVLDTETTGLEIEQLHRIIEVGCVELINRRPTGRTFHRYLCPDREVDEAALRVHGLSREFLEKQVRFHQIADDLIGFITGAELIIHNAPFDLSFLDMELKLLPGTPRVIREFCTVLDTLPLARQMHPGQRNSLDALCKRYAIDNSHRELHGALLDAKILSEVYLAMTGGQGALTLGGAERSSAAAVAAANLAARPTIPLIVIRATAEELEAHERYLVVIEKVSGHRLWK